MKSEYLQASKGRGFKQRAGPMRPPERGAWMSLQHRPFPKAHNIAAAPLPDAPSVRKNRLNPRARTHGNSSRYLSQWKRPTHSREDSADHLNSQFLSPAVGFKEKICWV
ncbi:hypothetical protein OJAV_G00047180 [Oryzias javanicus]|uniref:Uncharacterized protein n=1 Tax=Oryzias javanicus TaxID=123683 RepID=A0A3S2MD59_ORYJA|nr:hypothetical protein OJAV_G00047180 [Oryzias javanicus]